MESCDLTNKIANQLYDECAGALVQEGEMVNARLMNETDKQKRHVLEYLADLMGLFWTGVLRLIAYCG